MYYVEFIRKKPGVDWSEFKQVIDTAYKRWVELHPDDAPVLAAGRTWRLGPRDASYMIVYRIPDFASIDDWSRMRREDQESAAAIEQGTLSVADIDAGIYEDIGEEML